MRFAAAWQRFWFTPRRAEDLAICRILFAAGMFLVGLARPIHEWGEVPAFYHQPAEFLRRLGIPILDTGVLQGMEFVWLGASAGTRGRRRPSSASAVSISSASMRRSFSAVQLQPGCSCRRSSRCHTAAMCCPSMRGVDGGTGR